MPMLNFLLSSFLLLVHSSHHALGADGGSSAATMALWCVAKNNAEDAALQAAIDWACGQGGADCGPVQPGGRCHDPADIVRTASYAFNDYYLKHGLTDESCYFSNTAALTSLNPSFGNCKFPSSLTVTNGSLPDSSSPLAGTGSAYGDLNNGISLLVMQWQWQLQALALCAFLLLNGSIN
ncbi:hypothetical protein MLD38_033321 [Melastoma candidum]|uniref:Uncharacterized protein n=1 Tax=Melastoma candidum TaxID=119954 RepID=A0ACB9M8M6_9MYRT|nr:hypothetical protein MLD38_033321 [Melastoma candidum]